MLEVILSYLMGNFCCNEETKGRKNEEYHFDMEKAKPYAQKSLPHTKKHLETVKEELNEYSEHSDYRSVSRASRN